MLGCAHTNRVGDILRAVIKPPVTWCQVLEDEYRALYGAAPLDAAAPTDPDERLRLAKPDAIVCDLWNILATDRIIFELSELPGAANQQRAVAARS